MKTTLLCLLALVELSFVSCDLDSLLFKEQQLSSYTLSTAVIPESKREFVTLNSQGKRIYGYFVKSNGAYPNLTVLYFHGNRDHLQYYWDRTELFYRMGFNVFIFDYQGFGMSEGKPSESALYADARAALEYVLSRSDASPKQLAFYGFSLGCTAAIDVAAYTFTPRCLVLESPFASSSALLQSGTLLDIPSSYVMRGEYNNAEKIKSAHSPVLVIHGIDDKFVDIEKNGAVVFNNATPPKQFIRVPGADHSDVPAKLGEERYIIAIREYVLTPIPPIY